MKIIVLFNGYCLKVRKNRTTFDQRPFNQILKKNLLKFLNSVHRLRMYNLEKIFTIKFWARNKRKQPLKAIADKKSHIR